MTLPLPVGEGWGEGNFYCPSANLVIECDGSQHFTDDGLEADQIRDEALAELGLKVLRFDNGQIVKQLDNVVEQVYRACVKESPLFKGGLCTNLESVQNSVSAELARV